MEDVKKTVQRRMVGSEPGSDREVFDWTTRFEDDPVIIEKLLNAYDAAAKEAARLARLTVMNAKPAIRERAMWAEAVAQTLEAVLSAIPHSYEVTTEDGDVETEGTDGDGIVLPALPRE